MEGQTGATKAANAAPHAQFAAPKAPGGGAGSHPKPQNGQLSGQKRKGPHDGKWSGSPHHNSPGGPSPQKKQKKGKSPRPSSRPKAPHPLIAHPPPPPSGPSNWSKLCAKMGRDPLLASSSSSSADPSSSAAATTDAQNAQNLLLSAASFSAATLATPAAAAAAATTPSARAAPSADKAKKEAVLGPFMKTVLTSAEERYVGVDCEMVGVGAGGVRSALAQVVIVDYAGRVLLCTYVKSQETVVDYRTAVSGIRPEHLSDPRHGAVTFAQAQVLVANILKGKIIVGHGLGNDFKALMMGHSWKDIRDTALYKPFCYRNKEGKLRPKRLKHLCEQHLGIIIQEGEHDPAEDARAALALYRKFRREWEAGISGVALPASSGAGAKAGASKGARAEHKNKPQQLKQQQQPKQRGVSRHFKAREEKKKMQAMGLAPATSVAAIASAGAGFFASASTSAVGR